MAFYKRNNEELLVAPNFVRAPDYDLFSEQKDTYTYPVDGWYWFDNLDAAMKGLISTASNTITMRQCRLQLLASGLLASVDAAINSIADESQRNAAKIEWEYAATVDRNSQWVANLASVLGLSSEQLDTLFAEAALL